MSKPRGDPSCGTGSGDALIRTERHPACRRRELRPGFRTERENLCHTDCPWVLLYVERWLKAPVRMEDGEGIVQEQVRQQRRDHPALWRTCHAMAREFPRIPFERYADDAICHCRTEAEARACGKCWRLEWQTAS
jgi:hypothetical protein